LFVAVQFRLLSTSPLRLCLKTCYFGGVDTNLPSLALPLAASLPLDKCGASYDECIETWLDPEGEDPIRFDLGFSDYESKLRKSVKEKALKPDGENPGCIFHLGGRLKKKVETTPILGAKYKSRNTDEARCIQLAIGCYLSSAWLGEEERWRVLFPTFRREIRAEVVPFGLKGLWSEHLEKYFVKVWTGMDSRYYDLADWLVTAENRYLRSQGKQERYHRDLNKLIGKKKNFNVFVQGLTRQFELSALRYGQMKLHGIFDNVRKEAIDREQRIDAVLEKYGGWGVPGVSKENVLSFLKELTCARKDWVLLDSDEESTSI